MSLLDPKNILTGIFALAATAWAGYAVLFSGGSTPVAVVPPPATTSFALKPSRKLEIRALLTKGRIDQLEALLTGLQDRFEAGTLDEQRVNEAFGAFATSDPALKNPLDAWNSARPNSFAAALARARYFKSLAWKSRGSAVVASTPPKRITAMRDYMRRAQADIMRAYSQRPALIVALPTMIEVSYHLGAPGPLSKPIVELGKRYPCSSILHWTVIFYLQPQWSGSLAKIDAYTAIVTARCPRLKELRAYREVVQGRMEAGKRNTDGALRRYTKALSHRKAARYYYYRGMVYRYLKRHDEALVEFARSFALDQDQVQTLTEIAVNLFKRGRKEEALRLWKRALALDPYNPEVLIDRAVNLMRYDNNPAAWYETAMSDLKKAKRFGDDLAHISRYWYTANMRRLGLADGPALVRHQYYANPKDKKVHGLYVNTLMSRFTCERAAEFRSFLKRCPKIGLCTAGDERIYGHVLKSLVKRRKCS